MKVIKVFLPVGLVIACVFLQLAAFSEATLESDKRNDSEDEKAAVVTTTVEGEAPEPKWAIDVETATGSVLKFPFFDETITSLNPKLKESLDRDIKDTLEYLMEVMHYWLTHPGKFSYKYTYVFVGGKMVFMAINQHNRRKELDKPGPIKKQFSIKMAKLFDKLLKESKKDLKTTPKISADELDQQMRRLVDSFIEALLQSPVSIYLDFVNGKIDDRPFPEVALAVMKQLRMHGYEMPLNLFGRMIHKKAELVKGDKD